MNGFEYLSQPGHQPAVKRYQTEPEFHAVVDLMYRLMLNGTATGHDLREAAVLATIKFEMENMRPVYLAAP